MTISRKAKSDPVQTLGMDDQSDEVLIARIAAGDEAAFAALFRRYYKRLHRFLLRATSRHDLVDEVISETMHVVWRTAGRFEGRAKASTWISGIAYRRAISGLRRAPSAPADLDGLADVAAEDNVEQAGALGQQRRHIQSALARLSRHHRALIELTYFHGHSCLEVAEILNCPVGTVKSRMTHAREQLRRLLADHASSTQRGTELR